MDHCCSLNDLGYYVQQTAILGLGLIGAGTNNARIAGMLRNLSSYYYKDPSLLFCVSFCLMGSTMNVKGLIRRF